MILARPLYQPIESPELESETALQPCVERMELMLAVLGDRTGSLVDLGCHTGWFCRAFARRGWDVLGIDKSADWVEVARGLNTGSNAENIPWLPAYRVMDLQGGGFPKSDVALCLSVAMYLFQESAEVGWTFLQRVSRCAPLMFFDFGGMYAHHLPFNEATALEHIVANTDYSEGRLLGHTAFESRPFFVFNR